MANITFRLENIRAERYTFEPVKQLGININIMLGKLEKKDSILETSFVVKLECRPPIASIDVKGTLYFTPTTREERLDEKALSNQLANMVYSYVLPIIALLSRELGLPPPVPQPASKAPRRGNATTYL